jgi:predicted glycogen debranching enzyme
MDLPVIEIEKNTIQDLNKSKKLEWIITNGMGCYSSSTITGMNTRKYHGLLIASNKPPLDRKVILSKLEEEIILKDKTVKLSTNRYTDVVHPEGYKNQVKFELNPFPQFTYNVNGVEVKKSIFMVYGKNIVIVKYEFENVKEPFVFRIHPLINYRSIYFLTKSQINFKVSKESKTAKITFPDNNFLIMNGCDFKESGLVENEKWYKNFFYETDAERGEDGTENNYNPGYFEFRVYNNTKNLFLTIGYSVAEKEFHDPEKIVKQEIARKKYLLTKFFENKKIPEEDWIKWLALAADSHIITRFDNKKSIIAGYHWFGEWGRDSMISLPGLCLTNGKVPHAKEILKTYASFCKNGLIPNVLPIGSENPSYNSVDTSLLFIDRVHQVYKHTKDLKFVKEVWSTMKTIVESYMQGTDFGIKMDNDRLILHGPGLTWMDVCINGKYITPRDGKAVEIQALWYNVLKIMEFFSEKFKEDEKKYLDLSSLVKKNFNEKFWNGSYLDDCLGDKTLRPNQLFAIGLDHSVLDEGKWKQVLSVIIKDLLTDFGLRTLPKSDPRYRSTYSGNLMERDATYHQGTIWPWLWGIFIKSWVKATGQDKTINKGLKSFIEAEIRRFGLGTASEIVDADKPFESKGCVSQAWSIGEILASFCLF